jgi:hypothetical protein
MSMQCVIVPDNRLNNCYLALSDTRRGAINDRATNRFCTPGILTYIENPPMGNMDGRFFTYLKGGQVHANASVLPGFKAQCV